MASALTAPLTATLRYPFDHLIALARLILVDYQAHFKAQEAAADEADDEDEFFAAFHSLGDVNEITWLLDRGRWMKEEEAKKPYTESVGNEWKGGGVERPETCREKTIDHGFEP